jgi:branched-chain amino acid transport system ATP-binding protein
MSTILQVNEVNTYIGQFHILEGISFKVQENSITALLGRNGAGKTTTLRTIMGILGTASGSIEFKSQAIHNQPPHKIARLGIGYVPDYRAIFRQLTVEENLLISEREKGDLDRKQKFIFELFPDLERLYRWPGGQLSGGQQQMLAIARALVPENQLLLIDEPSEGLAPVIVEQMMKAIRQLSEHVTVLLVEQNFIVASRLSDHFVIIEDGKSVLSGEMDQLTNDPELTNRYLGAA